MKLQEQLNRIHQMMGTINEDTNNPAKQKLETLIEKQGLRQVVKMIGVDKVSKILETTPLQLTKDFFLDKTFSIDDFDIESGGYDFNFEITDIDEKDYDLWYVYTKIGSGSVLLLTYDNYQPQDLWDSNLWEEDYWWEIQGEMMEIINDILRPFEPKTVDLQIEHNLM